MTNSLEIATWDSDFFGYPIGKVRAKQIPADSLQEIKIHSAANGIKLLYLFADPSDQVSNQSALAAGAELADQKVIYFIRTNEITVPQTDDHIELYSSPVPNSKLIDLSIQSGLYSRYKLDKNFKNQEFERLYTAWIENSVNKKIADFTFVYRENSEILGFITMKINGNSGQIGLIAVDETSRGKSIGKKLIFAVMNQLKQMQITDLDVATQSGNEEACQFYQRVGFTAAKRENIYHIWL